MSQIDKVNEDTDIPILNDFSVSIVEGGDAYSPEFRELRFSSREKKIILDEYAIAMANGLNPPFIILAPISYLSDPSKQECGHTVLAKVPKYLTYPIIFLTNKVYFIEQITEVICLESK
jgi:hypothetical protein